jgi:hypothetical protein
MQGTTCSRSNYRNNQQRTKKTTTKTPTFRWTSPFFKVSDENLNLKHDQYRTEKKSDSSKTSLPLEKMPQHDMEFPSSLFAISK